MKKPSYVIKRYSGKKLCEALKGLDPDSPTPKLLRCNNKATCTFFKDSSKMAIGVLLCTDCREKIKERYEKKIKAK